MTAQRDADHQRARALSALRALQEAARPANLVKQAVRPLADNKLVETVSDKLPSGVRSRHLVEALGVAALLLFLGKKYGQG